MSNNRRLKVFLDDERPTPSGWTRAYWPQEVIAHLRTGNVSELSLDHDLGNDARGTGYDVVLWVEEQVVTAGFQPPKMKVHSANTSARQKMEAGIRQIERMASKKKSASEELPYFPDPKPQGPLEMVAKGHQVSIPQAVEVLREIGWSVSKTASGISATPSVGVSLQGCRDEDRFWKWAFSNGIQSEAREILSTKSEGEKDDEKASELVKPPPTKKPPRQDLRRHRVKVDDPDVEKPGADNDKDLSMNYKRVARRFMAGLMQKAADDDLARLVQAAGRVPSDKNPKDPGDYWQNDSGGWSAKDPEGQTTGFQGDEAEAQAEAWAEGGKKEEPEVDEDKEREKKLKQQQKVQKQKIQESIQKANAALGKMLVDDRLDKKVSDNLSAVLDVQDADYHKEMVQAFESSLKGSIDKLTKASTVPKGMINAASTALDLEKAMHASLADPSKMGKVMSDYVIATRILANPSIVSGRPVGEVGESSYSDRAWDSFQQYNSMTSSLRQEAMDQLAIQLEDILQNSSEKESDTRYRELKNIETGLILSALLNDQDPVTSSGQSLRPKPSEGFKNLVKAAHQNGALETLVRNGGSPFGEEGRRAVRKTLDYMTDDELAETVAGSDSPYASLGEVLGKGDLPAGHQAFLRDLIKDLAIMDMDRTQSMLNSFQRSAGKGEGSQDQGAEVDFQEMARQQALANDKRLAAQRALQECLEKSDNVTECEELAQAVKLAEAEANYEAAKSVFPEEPPVDDPDVAQIRDAVESQNPDVLNETWVRQGEEPKPSFLSKKPEESIEKKRQRWLYRIKDPKERDRIMKMSPDEFMAMVRSIMKNEEEEEEGDEKQIA